MTPHVQIAGIELAEELGRGAYSVVYAGRQGGAPCAVKVPRKRGRWAQWVYREAVALARVRHAGLPAVLEVGESQGLPYLVMELVAGETLADRLRRGPLDEPHLLDVALHLASALAAVHDAGLVHRDVKPRNIILEATGTVRLVDFGFATPMERSGVVDGAGTPDYAAPEQLRTPSRLDGRSDLFALGRVLFECLTGRLPPREGSAAAPETLVEELVTAGISESFARVVVGMLPAEPEQRYPDAHALLTDLAFATRKVATRGPAAFEPTRYEPPLVAREDERDRVLRSLVGLEATRGALVLVRGPRGGGKTCFLAACMSAIRSSGGRRILSVECHEGDPPLSGLRAMIDAYLDLARRLAPKERAAAEKAFRVAADHLEPLVVLIAPRAASILGSAPVAAPTPEAFLEGAAELIVRLARAATALVVFVDDIQWMDRVSRDVLLRVAGRLDEAPLGLVVASRPEGVTMEVEAVLTSYPARTSLIELDPLDEQDIAELIARHLSVYDVDPALVHRVASLADGTPLGVLEVLGALLDVGAVRPHARAWTFDAQRADVVRLPEGAFVLLGRRLAELPEASRRVLEGAAVLGTIFEDEVLGKVIALDVEYLGFALAAARRAGILEPEEAGRHRFLHDSLREMLLQGAGEAERQRLHQRVAEIYDDGGDDGDRLYRAALHYSVGQIEKAPVRALEVARRAADSALASFDNEAALRFLDFARAAAGAAKTELEAGFYRSLGEAHLRVGAVDDSLGHFADALDKATDNVTRASTLERIAWVHQARGETEPAWAAVERAFDALGARMPTESVTTIAHAAGQLARYGLGTIAPRLTRRPSRSRVETELLCELHFQNARLGLQSDKPLRLIQSTLEMVGLSQSLGPSSTLARSLASYGSILTFLSRKEAGEKVLDRARTMAIEQRDPVTLAWCVQQQGVASSFAGEMDRALEYYREALDVHGSWLEFNEFCGLALSAELIESMRGRSSKALPWVTRALDRLRRGRQTTALFLRVVLSRAQAAQVTLGRDATGDEWLAEQIRLATDDGGPSDRFHRKLWWGPRARLLVDTGDIGPEFEALVRDFEAEKHNPKTVHPLLIEYYIVVVHARIHQCLRQPAERQTLLAALRSATRDMRTLARVPLLEAHALYAEGCVAYFEGDRSRAYTAWGKAEAIATEQSCTWVLYGIARVRAHLLRESKNIDSAREQARVAEMLAQEHGSAHRARWIREEFGITGYGAVNLHSRTSMGSRSSRRARRQLAALLDVMRLPRIESRPEQQASKVLDELLRHLDAERGLLLFQPQTASEPLLASRARRSESWTDPDGWREDLVRAASVKGAAWPPELHGDPLWAQQVPEADAGRVVALPLFLRERTVGAVFLERGAAAPVFGPDDRVLVDVLSHQVPVALELARLVAEREQVQASLQHAQKLESLGRLAGGLAHDFNNMLFAIQGSASLIREQGNLEGELAGDLDVILDATDRAAKLTKQLLSFSRHQVGPLVACDVGALIHGLEPMLRRVIGGEMSIVLEVEPEVHDVLADPASLEQALVNLVLNARDAMPAGGTLTIAAKDVFLGEDAVRRGAPEIGDAVAIEVSDTGAGMTREVMARIFEPFFTTKAKGGTGLGLATVYAFVKNCGGHVEVTSELGRGTSFRLYFQRATDEHARATSKSTSMDAAEVRTRDGAILIVDDDESVRRSTRRMLEHHGYFVLDASTAGEALEIVRHKRKEIALMIVDVVMPDTSGPDLARQLVEIDGPSKVLFMSGFAPGNGQSTHDIGDHVLLEKPFSTIELLARVEALLPDEADES